MKVAAKFPSPECSAQKEEAAKSGRGRNHGLDMLAALEMLELGFEFADAFLKFREAVQRRHRL